MKKRAIPLVLIGIILVLLAGSVFSASKDHYYVANDTGVIWDKRMPDHFPDQAYIHVEHGVDKFMVTIQSSTYGPLDLTVLSPNGTTLYDHYSTYSGNHNLGKMINSRQHGAGTYTVKVFQGHTGNIGYLITIKGPRAIGLDECPPGCDTPCGTGDCK